jgi:hypothetical protein
MQKEKIVNDFALLGMFRLENFCCRDLRKKKEILSILIPSILKKGKKSELTKEPIFILSDRNRDCD